MTMISNRLLLTICMLLFAAVCTSTSAKPTDGTGLATVRAKGGGVGNFLAMVLQPIGEARNFEIKTINGESVKAFGNSRQVRLPPGHYDFAVLCGFNVDNQLIYLDGTLGADVAADHTYEISGELPADHSRVCSVRITDKTK